jgi:hypothetical protein
VNNVEGQDERQAPLLFLKPGLQSMQLFGPLLLHVKQEVSQLKQVNVASKYCPLKGHLSKLQFPLYK